MLLLALAAFVALLAFAGALRTAVRLLAALIMIPVALLRWAGASLGSRKSKR